MKSRRFTSILACPVKCTKGSYFTGVNPLSCKSSHRAESLQSRIFNAVALEAVRIKNAEAFPDYSRRAWFSIA